MDLKLFTNLQGTATANLLLTRSKPGLVQYYLVSSTVNASIVLSGECDGEIDTTGFLSFDISLQSLVPLLSRGFIFKITYFDGVLRFMAVDANFYVEPLCVERSGAVMVTEVQQYLDFTAWVSQTGNAGIISLDSFKRIATIANKFNTTVAMCGEYALVSIPSGYVFQKSPCDVRAISGKILSQLLSLSNGCFYSKDGDLVYLATSEERNSREGILFVYLYNYLPSNVVDGSLITKGAVLEKYVLNIGSIMSVLNSMQNKFTDMDLDMGNSQIILTNSRGESLVYKMNMESAITRGLRKVLRGESNEDIKMATITVPKDVQRILGFFRDDFTIYVKSGKIIFKSEELFLVFSR